MEQTNVIQCCFERYENKYFLTRAQYEAMLRAIEPHTQPDAYPRYTIHNLYFDTDTFQLARDSMEKPVYKEKLRLRSYGVVSNRDVVFLEMKKKMNGLVFKRRVDLPMEQAMAYLEQGTRPDCDGQILREIDWLRRCYELSPKAFIGYDREAYSGTEDAELRITFDTNILWRDVALDLRQQCESRLLLPADAILMEIKVPGPGPFWLARAMGELGIRKTSFSKYGTCYCRNLFFRPAEDEGIPAARYGHGRSAAAVLPNQLRAPALAAVSG